MLPQSTGDITPLIISPLLHGPSCNLDPAPVMALFQSTIQGDITPLIHSPLLHRSPGELELAALVALFQSTREALRPGPQILLQQRQQHDHQNYQLHASGCPCPDDGPCDHQAGLKGMEVSSGVCFMHP